MCGQWFPAHEIRPETKKNSRRFEEVTHAYDVKPDKNGDVGFTNHAKI